MGFADIYFERQKDFQVKIQSKPQHDLKFIAVIPCFNEFNLIETLISIKNCEKIKSSIEVIIVINSAEDTQQEILDQNIKTFNEAKNWIAQHEDSSLRFFILHENNLPKKFAGAGLARKIGMDQAVARFNQLNKENGIIISLDADVLIKENYFIELEKHFYSYPKTNVATIYFEHPIEGNEFDLDTYSAITTYELYLRYYKQALRHTGFPYSFHTIGSCFAINTKAYAKQGGMNKKQAGEDFYLLHKVFPLGHFNEINTTCVYPSSRVSERVPFGTGPMVKTIIESNESDFLTYNFESFLDLKSFFELSHNLYEITAEAFNLFIEILPKSIGDFLKSNDFDKAIQEINENSSQFETFLKRFFDWFNAFRVLKFLNFAHVNYYEKQELMLESEKLLQLISNKVVNEKTNKNYLEIFRSLERQF
jgi:cellulose synthase/poly-beta-1,6-N-acetylglucosamine synthase-like glycosyltransferase